MRDISIIRLIVSWIYLFHVTWPSLFIVYLITAKLLDRVQIIKLLFRQFSSLFFNSVHFNFLFYVHLLPKNILKLFDFEEPEEKFYIHLTFSHHASYI